MSKKYYRYFGCLLSAQEKWLNKMSARGYRLIRAEKLLYEFEECSREQYQYCIEFIAQKSKKDAEDYRTFLEDMGYNVFFKNINIDYSVGKVRYRPWAERGGRIAADSAAFNRELLIVEKKNDGRNFELHTSYEDRIAYCKTTRNPWLCLFLLSAGFGIIQHSPAIGIMSVVTLIPIIHYQIEIVKISRKAKIKE